MKLSIVTTLYQSSKYIRDFHQKASKAAQELSENDYEIIFVNDGSPDNSLDIATQITRTDNHTIVIDLSRNFGHHKAMMTGLYHATGDKIFLIDSDLEEDPDWLRMFSRKMEIESCDVVYGVQTRRKGGAFERFSGWLFYKMFNSLTGLKLPENAVTARLMTRRYLDALLLHEERELSIGGLFVITGFKQCPSEIIKLDSSKSTYSLRHKIAIMVDSVTSFSNRPLVGIFYVGLLILLLASANVIYLFLNRLIFSTPLTGWTSVMASIWFLGGLIVLFIGIVGIYLSKIFAETKQRPNSIVRHIYKNNE